MPYFTHDDIQNMHEKIDTVYPDFSGAIAFPPEQRAIFIGSGISQHLGMPSWSEFSQNYLRFLCENKDISRINYLVENQMRQMSTIQLLTLCTHVAEQRLTGKYKSKYKEWFTVDEQKLNNSIIYQLIFDIGGIIVTTNYDDALDKYEYSDDLDVVNTEEGESTLRKKKTRKVVYELKEFEEIERLDLNVVYHIHGSINNPNTMLISDNDYIKRYFNNEDEKKAFNNFFNLVFRGSQIKTILFLGYGLEEREILQFLFHNQNQQDVQKRFLLFPCYAHEYEKINLYQKYYWEKYKTNLIPCDISQYGFDRTYESMLTCIADRIKNPSSGELRTIELINLMKEAGIPYV